MPTRLATLSQQAASDAVVDRLDAGAAAGTIELRTGAQPATPNTAVTGTLLATLTFGDPAFGAANTSGTAAAAAITQDNSADASGVAGYARCMDSDGNAVIDVEVGVTGSGASMEIDDINIVAGGVVTVTSFTYTQPGG